MIDKKQRILEIKKQIARKKAINELKENIKKRQQLKEVRQNRAQVLQNRPALRPMQERALRSMQERALRPMQERALRPMQERALRPVSAKLLVENKQRTLNETVARNLAKVPQNQRHIYKTLIENIKNAQTLMEATQPADVAAGRVKTYFDIFFGYFPNLITPILASTQPIKTKTAVVFYSTLKAGSTKAGVNKGDSLITPFELAQAVDYTSNVLMHQVFTSSDITLTQKQVAFDKPTAIEIKNPATGQVVRELLTEDSKEFNKPAGIKQKLTYAFASDEITLTLDAADNVEVKVVYDNEIAPANVVEAINVVEEISIEAKTRAVKTNYAIEAGYGFEAQFGKKLSDRLAEQAMYELRREIDLHTLQTIKSAAPVKVIWNRGLGVQTGLYTMHKHTFGDAVITASNKIAQISRRVAGNILVVGANARTVIQTLDGYTPDASAKPGAMGIIGKYAGLLVVATGDLGDDEWLVVYKNLDAQEDLDAGLVFAPYIPVMATEQATLDDLMTRRAYLTSYGLAVVNRNYFVRGEIIYNKDNDKVIDIKEINK